jgi:hypothetical protein
LVLERLSAAKHGHLSAIHFGGVGVGIMVSAAAVSAMLAAGAGWQALWIGSGAIAIFATALVALLVSEQEPAGPSTAASSNGPPIAGLPALIVAYGLFGFGYVITATFLGA